MFTQLFVLNWAKCVVLANRNTGRDSSGDRPTSGGLGSSVHIDWRTRIGFVRCCRMV